MSKGLNKAVRIVAILLAQGVLVYGHFVGHNIITFLAFIVFFTIFLILSHLYYKLMSLEKRADAKSYLRQRNMDRMSGKWVKFKENGAKYANAAHPFSRDLDLFGEGSLFQYLNDTKTFYGEEILKILFLTEKRDKTAILRRQTAIKELAENHNFCESLKVEAIISPNISQNPEEMVNFFESSNSLFSEPTIKFLVRMLPIITILLVILNFIVGFNNALMIVTGFTIISQVLVFVSLSDKTEAVLKELSKFKGSLDDFGIIISLIKEAEFKAELNQTWQNKLPTKWCLKKITWALNIRNITILDLLLNILFLWDIHCVCILENMRTKGAKNMRNWLEAIGYFESMASMAVLQMLHPNWVYMEFSEELTIEAQNIGHPLIEEQNRITNDFQLNGIAIISGSNMSGKTTFLRTIGINLILGYMGAPVCAT